ncbi:Zn(II)2Cys6 transcription factor domain-containing protein [Aspergillus glaucus CBS 516.65]|uniref:Zn(2)-C6 fungal-type domain-containing protein n=1 Tax=Aspergillus glaucus CBS 516.65 TaxID=1160497 RepID=A0A1L9VFL9_ASPGL|nr:hypothetical protein ASPGLDRAFT_59054 [Aspergillus glaucus CBS 516.65]OJJ82622.1 hypothetical protein ASPGLDRAFT_59054 [Aspergillus glaucus CBS 516.65]
MPGVPSNKACERCKKRHLKCDEARPSCQRCVNAGVECPGYVQTRKFIDQGATIRRRYAPYQEYHPRSGAHKENDVPAENPIQEQMPVDQHGNDLQTITPVTEVHRDEGRDSDASQGAQGTPDASRQGIVQDPQIQTGVAVMPSRPAVNIPNIDQSILNTDFSPAGQELNARSLLENPNLPTSGSSHPSNTPDTDFSQAHRGPSSEMHENSTQNDAEEFSDVFSELMTGTEHEVAFLTRYFSEYLGPWLDLSDSSKFFTVYAPIRALNKYFLKYSMAALAAKHLGKMKGQRPAAGGIFTSPATMEIYPNAAQTDWTLKGANYYYLAFAYMRHSITVSYAAPSSSAILESPIEMVNGYLGQQPGFARMDISDSDTFLRDVEGLLATCVILTVYRLLDVPGDDWQTHLAGIESLFDLLLQLHTTSPALPPTFSQGERAAFWNFARQDYLASYFNRIPTHFKHSNLSLWKTAGIRANELEPLDDTLHLTQEDLAANTLIWLMNKMVNFLADYRRSQLAQWTESDEHVQPSTTTWLNLCFEFQSWFEKIPETFRPSLRIERPRDMSNLSEISYFPFPEIFFSLTSCAAAMQHYHFGRLGLLLNRPPDVMSAPGTAFDRLASLREVTKEVDYRCREICGIALSRPHGEVRIYMVPLLFAVGQCFETPETRQVIVDLLRGVEADLGWVTGSTVENLQVVWSQQS